MPRNRLTTLSLIQSPSVRRFLRNLVAFAALPVVLYVPLALMFRNEIVERAKGPTMRTQLETSFANAIDRDYDLLIVGNSRMYRGLNPDRFSVPTFNFAHDNDSYNQIYHKLRWLDEQGKSFDVLLLGVDFFQFSIFSDHRNRIYGELLGEDYLADYPPLRWYSRKRWADPGLIKSMHPRLLVASPENRAIIKPNGQYLRPGTPSPHDTVKRSTKRLDLQVKYFEAILQHCRQRDIKVYLCMLPIRSAEAAAYEQAEIAEFHQFIANYVADDCALIDHTFHPNYEMSDFSDITHLNEVAADRYSTDLTAEVVSHLQANHVSGIRYAKRSTSSERH